MSGKQYKSYVRCVEKVFLLCGGRRWHVMCRLLWNARNWSTHLLLVVIDELLIVLSSVSHGCCFCWGRKVESYGGYARKSGGKVRAEFRVARFSSTQLFHLIIADCGPVFCCNGRLFWSVIACSVALLPPSFPLWACIGRWLHPNDASRR